MHHREILLQGFGTLCYTFYADWVGRLEREMCKSQRVEGNI